MTQVLAVWPGHAEASQLIGLMAYSYGNLDLAIFHMRQACPAPRAPAVYFRDLAEMCRQAGLFAEGEQAGRRATALAPNFAAAWNNLGIILQEMLKLDESQLCLERALALEPNNPETLNNLGNTLKRLGRAAEAERRWSAALNRASLFMEFGRQKEARAAYEAAATLFPHSPAVLLSQADLKRIEPGDPLIGRMEALPAREGITVADRTTLHFGLGKAYLDIGDSARAFNHYGEGNRLKRATFAYDADETDRWMAAIAEVFSAGLLEAKADAGAPSDMPVFIVGMPRSGTTFAEQVLASHPMVHGAGELRTLQSLGEEAGFPASFPALPGERLKALGEAYLAHVRPLAGGRKRVIDKMPSNFALLGMIRLVLPDARVIHCRRDPVDTCLSCYTKLFAGQQAFAYDQAELGRFHRAYQRLMAHWRSVLPASHLLEVDYEAVIDDVEAEARRMLDFLGLPWDAGVLRFYETERPVRTARLNQVRQLIYRSSARRWRRHAAELLPLLAALDVPPA